MHPTSLRRETSLFNSPGLVPGFFVPKAFLIFIAAHHRDVFVDKLFVSYNYRTNTAFYRYPQCSKVPLLS